MTTQKVEVFLFFIFQVLDVRFTFSCIHTHFHIHPSFQVFRPLFSAAGTCTGPVKEQPAWTAWSKPAAEAGIIADLI